MANLSCGIVGLPNVGKSTLFKALTKQQVASENYPFCTIDPNIGVVNVPDNRLKILSDLSKSKKIVPATISFVDIAGLVKGASQGEGLGNKFLANIRETDAIIQVVRCFENEDITHVQGNIDPIDDIEVINLELILADLQMLENILQKKTKQAKASKEVAEEVKVLEKVKQHLDENLPVRSLELSDEELTIVNFYPFLTAKKVLYVANVMEEDLPEMTNSYVERLKEYAEKEGSKVISICAKIEEEIAELSDDDAQEFLESLGLKESGLNRLIHAGFDLLGLITYITTGEIETRAWTIEKGLSAVEAAGKIHTDIQKGFIRAEVISYNDMIACQSRVAAREAGKARAEGKDYIVQDGDVILFFHNT